MHDLLLKITKVHNWDKKRHHHNNNNTNNFSHTLLAKVKELEF